MNTDELKKLLAKATPGTWSVTDEHEILSIETYNDPIDGEPYENRTLIAQGECTQNWGYIEWFNLANAALIVAAVNALPGLLERVRRLEAALRPFTLVAENLESLKNTPDTEIWIYAFYVGDIRRACATLKETGQ